MHAFEGPPCEDASSCMHGRASHGRAFNFLSQTTLHENASRRKAFRPPRTWRLGGAGEEGAAHDSGGAQTQRLRNVTRVLDAAVCDCGHTVLVRHSRHLVHCSCLPPSHRAHLRPPTKRALTRRSWQYLVRYLTGVHLGTPWKILRVI